MRTNNKMANDNDKINALLAQEENLLNRAVVKTMEAYKQEPISANLKDWEAARDALVKCRGRKAAEANPAQAALAGIPEVLEYLKAEGWKIEKTKLYNDQGKIDKQKDGGILKKDADKYAAYFLKKLDGSDYEDIDPAEKIKWETEIAKQKAEKLTMENEINRAVYVLKSDVEMQLAARAAYLKDNLGMDFIHSFAPRIVTLVQGSQDKIPDLVDIWLEHIEEVFNHYSKPIKFEVPNIKTEGGANE